MVWPWGTATPDRPPSGVKGEAMGELEDKEPTKKVGDGSTRADADIQGTQDVLDSLLEQFQSTDLPKAARTDPSLPAASQPGMSLMKAWQYVPFFATQSTALTKAFVSHHLWGPPKQSWGVELTLFTTLLREAASYSHLSSLDRLRSVLEIGSLLPMPKDGIVTPISFRVKRRNLRGLLAESDAEEKGDRRVTGEWVITKKLWRKMQEGSQGKDKGEKKTTRVVLYLHGGAYYSMSAATHRVITISLSRYTECRIFAINYRLAPETKFPGQLHDAVSAYMRLNVDLKIPAENLIIAGDSAGGGLALATLMYLRDNNYPLPSGAILQSPWVDLTMSCESWTTNKPYDYLPAPNNDHLHPVKCLLGEENIHKYLTHPYVSPLFGDFTGLPPMLIQAGDAEVLRDEITLLAHKASRSGVQVEHELFEDAVHVFQAFLFLEASRKAFQSQRRFVKHTLTSCTNIREVDAHAIDREITNDAHSVKADGHTKNASLSPSPASREASLPNVAEDDDDDEDGDDDAEEQDDEDDLTGSSDGGALSPNGTLTPDPSSSEPRAAPDFTPTSPMQSPKTVRPVLRGYPSSKSLEMSQANGNSFFPGLRSSAPEEPLQSILANSRSPHSSPSLSMSTAKRRHARSPTASSISFSRRMEVPPRLSARSNSHPDMRALLAEYEKDGPCFTSRVYGPAGEGHATPPDSRSDSEENSVNGDDEEEQPTKRSA